MKKLKRVLSLTVAAAIMAASVDVSNVMAAEVDHEGVVLSETEVSEESDFVIEDGVLKWYQGTGGDVVIPSGVTSIGRYAFMLTGNSVSSIEIPSSVTSIGAGAFSGCINLSAIEIPSSVMSFGKDAFKGTKWLENKRVENPLVIVNGILIDGATCSGDIVIPEGVIRIGDGAFAECPNLKNIELPFGLKSIGNSAFLRCMNLSSIKLSSELTIIEDYAFAECDGLESIEIPLSVTNIASTAFIYFQCPGSWEENRLPSIRIFCDKDSYAEAYAKENNISYSYMEVITPSEPSVSVAPSPSVEPVPSEEPSPSATPKSTSIPVQQKNQTITAKNITKTYGNKSFNIGAKTDGNGAFTYTSSDKKVATVSKDGKVTIKGCGKTTITIKASETKEYKAAEKKITITVNPKKQTISSLKSTTVKTITVKWKKDTKSTGYVLQYSMDKNFKKNVKNVTISSNKITSKKISKLTAGRKYYVRICSYHKVSGTKLKGSYSTVKSVTVKK